MGLPHHLRLISECSCSAASCPLFLLFSSTAAAQGFLCDVPTGTGSPALIRGEGVAEKVNDIVITCTGGTPPGPIVPTADFTVALYNMFVTSRVVAPLAAASEAVLIIDDLASPPAWELMSYKGPALAIG